MNSLLWRKIVGAAIIVGLILPASVSAAGIGGRPANPDPNNPRTQSIFIYNLSGGAAKSDQLHLQNGLDEKATVEVYAVDGTVTATGDMTCKQKAEDKVDAGKWVNIPKQEITLEAKESKLVDFMVKVPSKVDVGEHNACIVVQRKNTQPVATGGVQIQTRQAIRMAIVVPGDIHRDVTIDKFDIKNENGSQLYEIALKNSGNVSADVDIKLVVKDAAGNVVYKNGGVNATIANEIRQFRYESKLAPFWGGRYKAELSISYKKKAGEWGIGQNQSELITKDIEPKELFFWPSIMALAIIGGALLLVILLLIGLIFVIKRRKKSVKFGNR
jgi:dihydroorotate oxidase B, electron transfer subunit